MRRALLAAVALLLAVCAAACGSGSGAAQQSRTLTVLAASSLTEAFTGLAHRFEAGHPGVDVRLTFDSSATLAQQAVAGAPGDVLATADARTMRIATRGHATAGKPRVFATNTMVLVVPRSNPAHVTRLADLASSGVAFVMCAPSAPCGALGRTLLRLDGVHARPKSLEVDVKAVLTKVELGEADAGLVYRSDAVAAGRKVRSIEVPNSSEAPNPYLIATLAQAGSPQLAQAWTRLVLSPAGRHALHRSGFGAP